MEVVRRIRLGIESKMECLCCTEFSWENEHWNCESSPPTSVLLSALKREDMHTVTSERRDAST